VADGRWAGVHPLILVELAAQTAGVCNGWGRIQTQGRDSSQMGWLVAIKKAEFFIYSLPFGAMITARAETPIVLKISGRSPVNCTWPIS